MLSQKHAFSSEKRKKKMSVRINIITNGAIDKFVCKQVKESLNNDGFVVDEDNLDQYNENLNDGNLINLQRK
jgi:hypothetical protein